jgi:hypothetical protein
MINIHPHYITDDTGNKLSVILAIQEYKKIIEDLEELDDMRLYDEAHSDNEPSIPIDEAFKIIEANRQKR